MAKRRYGRRRRYRRYKRYFPRQVGTSSINKMRCCFTTEAKISLPIQYGLTVPSYPIYITPLYDQLITPAYLQYRDNRDCLVGAYHSATFRKLLCIYSELKIEGMSCRVTPVRFDAENGVETLNIIMAWDRTARSGSWNKYGHTSSSSRMIRDDNMEQAGYTRYITNSKGGTSAYSSVWAKTLTERSSYMPTKTTMLTPKVIDSQNQKYYCFYNSSAFYSENLPVAGFNPGVFVTCETPNPATGSATVWLSVQCKFYITFRAPGINLTASAAANKLLEPTEDLTPFIETKNGDIIRAPCVPDPDTYEVKEDEGDWFPIEPPLVDPDDPISPVVPVDDDDREVEESEDVEPASKRLASYDKVDYF